MSNLTDVAKGGARRMTSFGILSIVLGMLAMLSPGVTGTSIIMFLGGLVIVSGIVRMMWAFQSGSLGGGLWVFAIGVLTLLCGIGLLANPLFASGVLTIMLAVYFIADGVSELAAGFGRIGDGGGWLLFSGIVSILLGAMIWGQFPLSGVWAMGTLLGIKLFFIGLNMIMCGTAVRSMATA